MEDSMLDPTLEKVVSQTCTAAQFKESHYLRLANEIRQEPRFHRKQWEYIYILRALEQFDLLRAEATGIGFGCGKEPLAVVMANAGARVVVTDIPPLDSSDRHWGSAAAMDLFYGGICSEERYLEHVTFRAVNMNEIPPDLGTYDFLWSCCALEHLGSLRAGMDFIINSTKCLKPGGVAIHTTELNMSSDDETFESPGLSLYRKRDLHQLAAELLQVGCQVLPMNFYSGEQPEDVYVDLPPYKQEIHLKLQVEKFAVTSFGLIVVKTKN
jgi:2-polyprenyl-3-methyl-5-hydroxy-6-metoxy-1,4-benzoquinol methylase